MRHLLSMGLLVSFHVPHHGLFTLRSQQSYRSKRKTLFFAWVKMSPCQISGRPLQLTRIITVKQTQSVASFTRKLLPKLAQEIERK